jgi:hypothetical protein
MHKHEYNDKVYDGKVCVICNEKKPSFFSNVLSAIGNAIGNWKFGGGNN